MPQPAISAVLSIIAVIAWSSVYYSSHLRGPPVFVEQITYDGLRKSELDYNAMLYPMDDPSNRLISENVTIKITSKATDSVKNDPILEIFALSEKPLTDSSLALNTYNLAFNTEIASSTTEQTDAGTTVEQPITNIFEEATRFAEYDTTTATTHKNKNKTGDWAWMRFDNLTMVDKRNHVKKMMKHAWDNYVKYAWGKNELKSISKRPHFSSVFGGLPTGVTIIDSLDTLHIMGLIEEYKQGRDWVANELNITSLVSEFPVFETNIRLVGGLLSCYALTGNSVFREKAQQIVDKLLPAFETPTGIPHSLVDFSDGTSRNYGWASAGSSILSEIGTLHLEFAYLSDVTGNPIYRNKTEHVRQVLNGLKKPNGLYPNYINANTGNWNDHHSSVGSLGDSFYEYLLKSWLQSNKEDALARKMYDEAMLAILEQMLQVSRGGLTYFAEKKYDILEHRMEHLGCFTGGLLALGAKTLKNELSDRYLDAAKGITHTCHETYDRSYTKLGPEAFRFNSHVEARAETISEDHYILRPEVVESYFYLFRLTKEQKYQDWGWEAVEALERYCRVDGGYTGISDVYSEDPDQDDVQQSFFMSETLKYLYLLFSDDTVFSLDEWVFNTEAHPLPIKHVNPYYRAAV